MTLKEHVVWMNHNINSRVFYQHCFPVIQLYAFNELFAIPIRREIFVSPSFASFQSFHIKVLGGHGLAKFS